MNKIILKSKKRAKKGLQNPFELERPLVFLFGFIGVVAALYGGGVRRAEAAAAAAIFAGFAFLALRSGGQPLKGMAFALPLFCLAGYSLLQGALPLLNVSGTVPDAASFLFSHDPASSIWNAFKILALALFVLGIVNFFRSGAGSLASGIVLVGSLTALAGIFRFAFQSYLPGLVPFFFLSDLTPGTGFGPFVNRNHFAFLMLLSIGPALALARWGTRSQGKRVVYVMCSIICLIALILSGSRGGIISVFAVAAAFVLFPLRSPSKNRKKGSSSEKMTEAAPVFVRILLLGAVSAILVLGVIFVGQDRVVTRFEQLPRDVGSEPLNLSYKRMDAYRATASMIATDPVFGVGFGGYANAISGYLHVSGYSVPEQAHNDYLEFAASGGMISILAALWFIFAVGTRLRRSLLDCVDRKEFAAYAGAVCAFSGAAVHSLFDYGGQFLANQLVLCVLVAIAVSRTGSESNDGVRSYAGGLPLIALALLGTAYAAVYGLSGAGNPLGSQGSMPLGPYLFFDSETYAIQAEELRKNASLDEALEKGRLAARYEPNDFRNWLFVGELSELTGNSASAVDAYSRAAELAPYYGLPKYRFGRSLIASGKAPEGFALLREAFRSDPRLFPSSARLALEYSNRDVASATELIGPIDSNEALMLTDVLLKAKDYGKVPELVCRFPDLTPADLVPFVQKLIEEREFRSAYLAESRQCAFPDEFQARIDNPDFSAEEVDNGIGFGWRSDGLPPTIRLQRGTIQGGPASQALQVRFGGASVTSHPIVSQLIPVRSGKTYRIGFAYRTIQLVTGSDPVILAIPKSKENDGALASAELSDGEDGWTRASFTVTTGPRDEVIEIRLARGECGSEACAAFGRLIVTDFSISEAN